MTTTTDRPVSDPRPRARVTDAGVTVYGWRCTACAYPSAQEVLRCPVCRAQVEETTFVATGEVWASTCLRVRVPGYQPPFAVAYLVLDDGPRVLVHTPGDQPLVPGTRARVTAVSAAGDLVAESTEEDAE